LQRAVVIQVETVRDPYAVGKLTRESVRNEIALALSARPSETRLEIQHIPRLRCGTAATESEGELHALHPCSRRQPRKYPSMPASVDVQFRARERADVVISSGDEHLAVA